MNKTNEDAIPERGYKYIWTPASDISLDDFLSKYKPSMVENDGSKPWIWVRKGKELKAEVNELAALEESSGILKDITDQIENIKNDSSIPTRSNKKTGAKSKKELREQLQHDVRAKFEEIARKHNYLSGKWLMFASGEKIDRIWSSLATSLINGPLADTDAFCAKVATTPQEANPNYQHVVCLYLPNVYDKDTVLKVMHILLRNHGFNLSGVKTNMYTLLGIDSKHPSGIPSTIWKNKDLMNEKEMQALKDAFYAELENNATATTQSSSQVDTTNKKPSNSANQSSMSKKKKKDIFASDDEEDDEEQRRRADLAHRKKAIATSTKRTIAKDESEDSDHEQEKPKRKAAKRS
ncbi:translation initiation factor eIF 4e-like domain-containing protein [Lentinula raphanica]|nr:translation initiation factor eIF 4e-like domain-containing protein [Lentinula raphanica]